MFFCSDILWQTAIFYKADLEYSTRVAKGLELDVKKVKHVAEMSQGESESYGGKKHSTH